MNITHFFFQLSYSTALKNKLQEEAFEYLKSLSNSVIHADDIEETQKIILEELQKINEKYPRCKSINFSFLNRIDREIDKQISLSGFNSVIFRILPAELKHITRIAFKSISNN